MHTVDWFCASSNAAHINFLCKRSSGPNILREVRRSVFAFETRAGCTDHDLSASLRRPSFLKRFFKSGDFLFPFVSLFEWFILLGRFLSNHRIAAISIPSRTSGNPSSVPDRGHPSCSATSPFRGRDRWTARVPAGLEIRSVYRGFLPRTLNLLSRLFKGCDGANYGKPDGM